ncbi:hypothetical protein TNCV_2738371 [Trichonephila clavipes]|nr:hypothetical protein TNCV_2738371 [Trichonephila clavipes]
MNHGQVTRTTHKLTTPSPNYHNTTTGRLRALTDLTCFNPSTRWIFSGSRIQTHDTLAMSHLPLGYYVHNSGRQSQLRFKIQKSCYCITRIKSRNRKFRV